VVDAGGLPADVVEAVLERHGALAVTLTDAGDEPVLEPAPGETPLWARIRVTGLFEASTDLDAPLAGLARELGLDAPPPHRVEALHDRAWEREWLKDFRPMRFGERLMVAPQGVKPGDSAAVVVSLDPGLAFGTGTHPTTALMLRWLDGESLAGRRVLDFGCGSGILAIAAAKLGASSVHAVDIDPQAITATRENARANGVADRITLGSGRPGGQYDLVVANILAGTLVEAAGWLAERLPTGGRLALSGILGAQAADVRAAYAGWIAFEPDACDEDWVRLAGRRR